MKAAQQDLYATVMRSCNKVLLLVGAEQGKEAKNGLAAPLSASEGRSDSVSLLERGGSTFSVESGDGVPEPRRSFQVRGQLGRASAAVGCTQVSASVLSPPSSHKQHTKGAATATLRRCIQTNFHMPMGCQPLAWPKPLCIPVPVSRARGCDYEVSEQAFGVGGGPTLSLRQAQGPLEELPDAVEGEPVVGRRRGALRSCLETVRRPLARGLNMSARNVFIAGAELGGWAFTANAIMVSDFEGTWLWHSA